MAKAPFKMKGSPMQRNFGIGSPLHKDKTKPAKTKEGGTTFAGKLAAALEAGKGGFSGISESYRRKKREIRAGEWKGFSGTEE